MSTNSREYQRLYQRDWRAGRRPYRSPFAVVRSLKVIAAGHCPICGLRCEGPICCFCDAEIEGRPLPRC